MIQRPTIRSLKSNIVRVLALALLAVAALPAWAETAFETTVQKWKDGKKATYTLAFDDSCPTHLTNVIPALEKRKIVGTFYVVTGNGVWKGGAAKWEVAAKSPYVELANHTFTHTGAKGVGVLDEELVKCIEVIHKLQPDRKVPRLIAFGRPGGVPWEITKEEQKIALAKHNLIDRPPFFGPPIHYKSAEEMKAAIDKTLAKGDYGHMDFHGVGGDWLTTPMDWFTALLDKLDSVKDQLWVTDTITVHKYQTERESAAVKVLSSDKSGAKIELTSKADPAFYDLPLTLSTKVPADWKSAVVEQGKTKETVAVANGAIQYSALPGGGEISIKAGQ